MKKFIFAIRCLGILGSICLHADILYILNTGSNNISVIDLDTNTVTATVSLGSQGLWMGIDEDGSQLYTVNKTSDFIGVIDTSTNTLSTTIAVGDQPNWITVKSEGNRAYVPNISDSNLSVINTSTNAISSTVSVGSTPGSAVLSPDQSKLFVSNQGSSQISVIDTSDNTIQATISVGSDPLDTLFYPDGSKAYVPNYSSNTISVVDLNDNSVTATVNVGTSPETLAITPEGSLLYVANRGANTVSVINTANNTVTSTVTVGTDPLLGTPISPAILPDGSALYVVNSGSSSVSVIDTSDQTVSATITLGDSPQWPSMAPDGSLLCVANYGDQNINLINPSTNTISATITVGTNPVHAIFRLTPVTLSSGSLNVNSDADIGTASREMRFTGGQLNVNTSFSSARKVFLSSNGTMDIASGKTFTLSGTVKGSSSLVKKGEGTLVLSSYNSYTGGTSCNAGTLRVAKDGYLGSSSADVTFNGGALETTATFSSSRNYVFSGAAAFNTNPSTTLTISGDLSSSGNVSKEGTGTLILSGSNTATGNIEISAGSLEVTGSGSLSGGALTVASSATCDISGMSAGSQTIASLAGGGNLNLGSKALTIGGSSDATFSGVISGSAGTVTKQGTGVWTISGANTYTGDTTVEAGTLWLQGTIAGDMQVDSSALLKGAGTVQGSVTVDGALRPGNSIGTINIEGDLTLNDSSTLTIELDPTSSSLVDITGDASIDGTLSLLPQGGSYTAGTTYTILRAGGDLSGTFDSLISSNSNLNFEVTYDTDNDWVRLLLSSIGSTSFSSSLVSSSASYLNYLINKGIVSSNPDLNQVVNALLAAQLHEQEKALDQLRPAFLSSYMELQKTTSSLIANTLMSKGCHPVKCSFWFEPFASRTSRSRNQELDGFSSWIKGFMLGGAVPLASNQLFRFGAGYDEGKMHLTQDRGKGRIDQHFIGMGWDRCLETLRASIGCLYGYHRAGSERNLNFLTVNRQAKLKVTEHEWTGKFRLGLTHEGPSFRVLPEFEANLLYLSQGEVDEKGAGDLDLVVLGHHSLQSRFSSGINLEATHWKDTRCPWIPYLGASVIVDVPIYTPVYQSRFKGTTHTFSTRCSDEVQAIFSPKAGFFLKKEDLHLGVNYQYELGSHIKAHHLDCRLNLFF